MALHPDVQKKAQKALDEVVGDQCLPDFTDFRRLPYLAAVVNEVFRWHPVTPFAVYHVSTEDDTYNGYDIPKGSIIIPNAWAVLRDESIFGPDTDKFIPERFVKADGSTNPDLSDVDVAFGFGRRACPGRCELLLGSCQIERTWITDHLAMCVVIARDTIWVMAASILTAYDISEAVDMDGRKLTAESPLEFTNAMIRCVRDLRLLACSNFLSDNKSFAPRFKVSFKRRIPESTIHEGVINEKLAKVI